MELKYKSSELENLIKLVLFSFNLCGAAHLWFYFYSCTIGVHWFCNKRKLLSKNLWAMLRSAKSLILNKFISLAFFARKRIQKTGFINFIFFHITYTDWTKIWSFYSSIRFASCLLIFKTLTLKKLNLYWTCYFSLFGIVSFRFDVLRLLHARRLLIDVSKQSGVIVNES